MDRLGYADEYADVLLRARENKRMCRKMETCNFFCDYNDWMRADCVRGPRCESAFDFGEDALDFDDYQYDVLLEETKRSQDWHGFKGRAIIEIKDKSDRTFYMWVKLHMHSGCESCDGSTTYQHKHIMYADTLPRLLRGVFGKNGIRARMRQRALGA